MIPEPIVNKLNQQIANEFHAEHNYIAMACRFDELGLKMLAKWFFRQGQEEREHGMKILNYLLEVGCKVNLKAIPQPVGTVSTPVAMVQAALEQEQKVTTQIHDIVALAEEHRDYATRSFLTWFVDEQVEEVASMTELLQLVQMAGEQHILQVEARVARMLEISAGS